MIWLTAVACSIFCADRFADRDHDGWGDPDDRVAACSPPPDTVERAGDCEDRDPDLHPDQFDGCDGVDTNCDGSVDEDRPGVTLHVDADGDGFGDPDLPFFTCDPSAPTGFVVAATDCDDANAAVSPIGIEVCNGVDDDCDHTIDDPTELLSGNVVTWRDADGDGDGDPAARSVRCAAGDGWVDAHTDCDDADPTVLGGAGCPPAEPAVGAPLAAESAVIVHESLWWVATPADLDGDGLVDLLAGTTLAPRVTGYVRAADDVGADWVTAADYLYDPLQGYVTVVRPAGDIDGDGDSDLVAVEDGAVHVHLLPLVAPTLGEPVSATPKGFVFWTDAAAAGDPDEDGDGDLWAVNGSEQAVSLMDASAPEMREQASLSLDTSGPGLATSDLDGDGIPELALSDFSRTSNGLPYAGRVWIASAPFSGIAVLRDAASAALSGEDADAYAGLPLVSGDDLDGDGLEDLVVGGDLATAVIGGALPADGLLVEVASLLVLGGAPSAWLPGDLDGDGAGDLALGRVDSDRPFTGPSRIGIVFGPASGTIDPRDLPLWIAAPSEVAPHLAGGDLDGDGVSELVVGEIETGLIYVVGAP